VNLESLREIGQSVYYGNTILAWAQAIVTFILWFTVLPIARAFVARRFAKRAADHPLAALLVLRSLIDATTRLFMVTVATYLALKWLRIPPAADRYIDATILVIVWLQVALWLSAAVRHAIDTKRSHQPGASGAASLNILRFVGMLAVWMFAFMMLLTNLGIKIGPLLAGLGIGGVAIALAVQNVLGDLLASLSIALDKPFKVGDFLILGEELGTVEYIGIKSTRLRSLSGEQIIISNGDLLKSRVRNYGRMYERRVVFTVSVVLDTPLALVREIPGILERAIRARPKTRFDRSHLQKIGDYALVYEAVYYVLDADYNPYMDIQQDINLEILEELQHRGIEIAVPTTRRLGGEPAVAAKAD
jgi:small-conductance mechanosensitive channel